MMELNQLVFAACAAGGKVIGKRVDCGVKERFERLAYVLDLHKSENLEATLRES
jgi:hypothetical protein